VLPHLAFDVEGDLFVEFALDLAWRPKRAQS
jgi:hypothetical protein